MPVHARDEGASSDDDGPMPMPMPMAQPARKKHKKLPLEAAFVRNLPSAAMYERSFMHRAAVSHVLVAPETQFVVTASVDGHVKFWKKMARGIEFVKHYKAHLKEVTGLAVSADGLRLCSASADRSLKFYDVLAFDMVNMLSVAYTPAECCWISAKGAIEPKVVVADRNSPAMRIYTAESAASEPVHTIGQLHAAPVTALAFNPAANCVISADQKGIIEYWDADSYKFPKDRAVAKFKFKGETDLYELAKSKTYATAIDVSADGKSFVATAKDNHIRVFRFATGKMRRKYDESLAVFEDAQADGTLNLDALDFGRRAAVERELANSDVVSNCVFDESGHFILYPTLAGIKVLNIETNKVVKVLGKVESSDRFLRLSLFQGKPKVNTQFEKHLKAASGLKHEAEVMSDAAKERDNIDPTLFCTSFKRNRFFLFSSREPDEDEGEEGSAGTGRDVFNEKPTLEEAQVATESSTSKVLGETAVMHTTMGDITLKLFGKECPKTVENFCTHARNGYYDNLIFHRVIKNFMVQTGDPLGDGTGGESIWGGEFEDEFHRNLRHDRPFTLSMANAGPGTNGSQFFITTVPTPWLDNKHTVFGRVEHGKDTVSSIENARVDKSDKPLKDIKIINIDIF
ncbi:Peptidylprolyl isomerase domain and WD repeat-containing protein 1 [Phytophthora cinnamomi]|uniref:Peptidylprolyl isomerase domain and WD repeat-containing protein 1 n=1 Tax=Phytophthora cinnamomi TaxID=4785 RepID=UPI00355A3A59|nr:Peptidylprolyl isomerase domain and WD repeat-containing protein 1 [Phytophthora cinnamomi]